MCVPETTVGKKGGHQPPVPKASQADPCSCFTALAFLLELSIPTL